MGWLDFKAGSRRRKRTVIPEHKIVQQNGDTFYIRQEEGEYGSKRNLKVWSWESCKSKLEEKNAQGKMTEFFNDMVRQLNEYKNGSDPMFGEWFQACFDRIESAYTIMLQANELGLEEFVVSDGATTVEDFGLDTVEDFGL